MLETGEVKFALTPPPASAANIVEAWEKATTELREQLRKTTDDQWARPARFVMNGEAVWSDTLENMWGYLFDMVHHRGQLTSYLRPMGGKVPSIYGPSADDSGS